MAHSPLGEPCEESSKAGSPISRKVARGENEENWGQKVNLFALTLMRGTTLLIVTAANYHLYCKGTITRMEDLYVFWCSM